jgi:hypothetical protein
MKPIRLAMAVVALGAAAALAMGDDQKGGAKKADAAGMTDARLKDMLENMG